MLTKATLLYAKPEVLQARAGGVKKMGRAGFEPT